MSANVAQENKDLDEWNSRERMFLADIVLFNKTRDWTQISDTVKSFASPKLRPSNWYSPENCAAQYQWMTKNLGPSVSLKDEGEPKPDFVSKCWKTIRKNELEEMNKEIAVHVNNLKKDLEILQQGVLDEYLVDLWEGLKKADAPFWKNYSSPVERKLQESKKAFEELSSAVTKGKASAPKPKDLIQITEALSTKVTTKEVVVHAETPSAACGGGNLASPVQGVTTPPKSSLEQSKSPLEKSISPIASVQNKTPPKAFFNPSNILSSTALFQFSSTTSHVTTPTTTVSSVTLSAPTLSKLLEMPPSFAGKLPPLPISPQAKTVELSKSPQKAIFKLVEISPTSDLSKVKTVAINKAEIKESDKKEQNSPKVIESVKSVHQKPEKSTVETPEQTSKLLQKSDKLSTPVKQEVIVTYFKPEEKLTTSPSKTNVSGLDKREQIASSPVIPSPIVLDKSRDLSSKSAAVSSDAKQESNSKDSDPFTFDENSDKIAQKAFTRGIKRKRESIETTQENLSPEKLKQTLEVSPEKISSPIKVEKPDSYPSIEKNIISPEIGQFKAKKIKIEPEIDYPIENVVKEIIVDQTLEKSGVENSAFDSLLVETTKNVSPAQKGKALVISSNEKSANDEPKEKGHEKETCVKPMTEIIKVESPDVAEETVVTDESIEIKSEDGDSKPAILRTSLRRGRRGRSKATEKATPEKKELSSAKSEESLDVEDDSKDKLSKIKVEVKKLDIGEDESTTSSRDSEKEFSLGSRSNTEDMSEKKTSEFSDDGENSSLKNMSTLTDASDTASTCPNTPVVRGKGRWSPQSIGPTSQSSSVVTPTTSDSSEESEVEESDDSANPKKSKLKWQDKESENKYKAWKKSISIVWREAANHRYANVFAQKVTDDVAPGYHNIVTRPMDLTTIKKNIDNGTIKTTEEFQRDVMLMFQNAIMYNSSDHDVYLMALEMQRDVIMQIQDLATQLVMPDENKEKTVTSSRNVRQSKVPYKGIQKSVDSKDTGK